MSLVVQIAAEFTGKKAFDKAGKSTSALEKGAKKLGGALAAAFATDKIIAFGKASIKAFAEEEKSAALLANTMKNLGVAFAAPQMETFISQLSQTAGVADDVLRPAMQKLLTQTGDYFKSQELLTQAIEISRGSGVELSTVVSDLSAAYVGNTKGLKKYNLGLTQAELKTMSFTDVQKKLNNQFKGSNAAYLETYAGKMEVLKTAAGEAQETIGKGLVDALMAISGDTSVEDLATSMQTFADSISNAIYGLGSLIGEFKKLSAAAPSWLKDLIFNPALMPGGLGAAAKLYSSVSAYGDKKRNQQMENPSVQMFKTDMNNMRLNNEKLKVEKKSLDLTKKKVAEDKKAAAAKKQSALFDLEKIGLVAALQGDITKEEKLRLELQLALLTGNDALATKLSAQLANSIDKTGNLAKFLTTLPEANNPFKNFEAYLDAIYKNWKSKDWTIPPTNNNPPPTNIGGFNVIQGASTTGVGSTANGDIIINIAGSVTSEEDLVAKIRAGIQSGSLSGKPADIGRLAGMFG